MTSPDCHLIALTEHIFFLIQSSLIQSKLLVVLRLVMRSDWPAHTYMFNLRWNYTHHTQAADKTRTLSAASGTVYEGDQALCVKCHVYLVFEPAAWESVLYISICIIWTRLTIESHCDVRFLVNNSLAFGFGDWDIRILRDGWYFFVYRIYNSKTSKWN